MNWLSTMKTRSRAAASAAWACSMYQSMSTLASPGISGSSQRLCSPGPPVPVRITPKVMYRGIRMLQSVRGDEHRSWRRSRRAARKVAEHVRMFRHKSWSRPARSHECRMRGIRFRDRSEDHVHAHTSARSEEHTSELQSLMRISYVVFCMKKK